MITGIGAATGPAVAGAIMDYTGQTITFLIFAATCIVVMIFSIAVHMILKIGDYDYQKLARDEEKESETAVKGRK